MIPALFAALALLGDAHSENARNLNAPELDACSSDGWVRPATLRVKLLSLDPEYIPKVYPVQERKRAMSLLARRSLLELSVREAGELTGDTSLVPGEGSNTLYLVRSIVTAGAEADVSAYDARDGAVLLEHRLQRNRPVELKRQPLVISFRGRVRQVYMSCVAAQE